MLSKAILTFNLIRNVSRPMLTQVRCYPGRIPAMKHELYDYIQWVRPAKLPSTDPKNSGDLRPLDLPEKEDLIPSMEISDKIKDASDDVKKLFSIQMNRRKMAILKAEMELVQKVQRHKLDFTSIEVKLAKMTARIRAGQQALETDQRNKKYKQKIKELIEKRKKWLKELRRDDYPKFEYVLEKLDLKYVPPPPRYGAVWRKEAMRVLTSYYCENIKNERLDSYRADLESKQIDFLKNKIKNLEFIRKEQQECKVPVTITEEQINMVRKQYEELKAKRVEQEDAERKREVREDYEIKLN